MKKSISILAVAAALLVGASSCSKDSGVNPAQGEGSLTVNFNMAPNQPQTRAISTAKPVTTWGSVSNMMIMFVNPATSVVEDARAITVPAAGAALTGQAATFLNVKAHAGWDCYIVGNYPSSWSAASVVGKNVTNQLNVVAPASATYAGSALAGANAGGTGYDEAPEIFVAKQPGVVIAAGVNNIHPTAFKLARAVSIVRVRVDQKNNTVGNEKINFAVANAMFAVRRATTTYALNGTYTYAVADGVTGANFPGTFTPAAALPTNVFYKEGALKTAAPASADYELGSSPLVDSDITLWNDYKIWAGGAENPDSQRFNIVLCGVTKDATYTPLGSQVTVAAGTPVYWEGSVIKAIGPNQILELVLKLEKPGTIDPPTVSEYANLDIKVDLLPWGDIVGVEIPM